MSSAKFEIEKFNGKNKFELWKLKMWDLLVQQGLQRALDGKRKKPPTMTDDEWEDLDVKVLSKIHLCLADDVLFNIIGETLATSLWNKLESLYMTIQNLLEATTIQYENARRYEECKSFKCF